MTVDISLKRKKKKKNHANVEYTLCGNLECTHILTLVNTLIKIQVILSQFISQEGAVQCENHSPARNMFFSCHVFLLDHLVTPGN